MYGAVVGERRVLTSSWHNCPRTESLVASRCEVAEGGTGQGMSRAFHSRPIKLAEGFDEVFLGENKYGDSYKRTRQADRRVVLFAAAGTSRWGEGFFWTAVCCKSTIG